MKKFVFNNSNEKFQIIFDDAVDEREEYDSWWVGMCSECFSKHKESLKNKADNCGSGICSVHGCNNEADFYIDFKSDELSEVSEFEVRFICGNSLEMIIKKIIAENVKDAVEKVFEIYGKNFEHRLIGVKDLKKSRLYEPSEII